MATTGTVGVTYAEAATVGTVAESKKLAPETVTVSDDVKPSSVKEITAKENSLKENASTDVTCKTNSDDVSDTSKKVDGSGDGKNIKPVKSAPASSKATKTDQVFVPAPPPATNAWAKRIQTQAPAPAPQSAAPSSNVASNQVACTNKQVVKTSSKEEHTVSSGANVTAAVTVNSTVNHPVGVSRAEVTGDGKTQTVSGQVSKVADGESTKLKSVEPVSIQATDDHKQPKSGIPQCSNSKESRGRDQQSTERTSAVAEGKEEHIDVHESSLKAVNNSKSVAATSELKTASGNKTVESQVEQSSSDHNVKSEDKRRWEKNQKGRGISHNTKAAGLNDSGDWPSLQRTDQVTQSPKKQNKVAANPGDVGEHSTSVEGSEKNAVDSSGGADDNASLEDQSNVDQNHARPLSDSGIEELSTKDALSSEQSKPKKKNNKQKWLPYEIELPKTRRRRGTGRTRTDSRGDHQDNASGDRGRDSRDSGRRPRGGHERSVGGTRRNRRDPAIDKAVDENESGSSKTTAVASGETSQQRGAGSSGPSAAPAGGRVGYQGSRRAANRGRAAPFTYNAGRGRFATPFFPGTIAQYPYMGLIETRYPYYPVEPTYFAPIVSQSDYYTRVLADESTKKLIAQQIEYYFSEENLTKDFYLRRQMDSDGWIAVDLLASFRRVRIHTGTVNSELLVESIGDSKLVEVSSDGLKVRAREEPHKWSLKGIEPTTFSNLSVHVPEFVPGKPFKMPTSPDAFSASGDYVATETSGDDTGAATGGASASAAVEAKDESVPSDTHPTTTSTSNESTSPSQTAKTEDTNENNDGPAPPPAAAAAAAVSSCEE